MQPRHPSCEQHDEQGEPRHLVCAGCVSRDMTHLFESLEAIRDLAPDTGIRDAKALAGIAIAVFLGQPVPQEGVALQ